MKVADDISGGTLKCEWVKILLLVYKALRVLAPKYIKELSYIPRRYLRSEAKGLLDKPRTRLEFGDHAFSSRF